MAITVAASFHDTVARHAIARPAAVYVLSVELHAIFVGLPRFGATIVNVHMNQKHLFEILDAAQPEMVIFRSGMGVDDAARSRSGCCIDLRTWQPDEGSGVFGGIAAAGEVAKVSVDYALSPEAKFPQAFEECAAVVRHLATHGADWQLDPCRIAVCGDSAGGNLALATGLLLRDTGGPTLRGILAAYPVCDSDFSTHSYRETA